MATIVETPLTIKKTQRQPVLTHAEGKDYHWGRMIGEAESQRIAAAQQCLEELPIFLLQKPWWMPFRFYLYYAERLARKEFQKPMAKIFPRLKKRLLGMAEGSGVRVELLCLFHMLEAACNQNRDPHTVSVPPGGCTAIGMGTDRVAERETVLLHNLDQVEQAANCLTVRESCAEGELRSLCLTLSPLCGVVDGMNEAGLSISYNYAAATEFVHSGTPVSLLISDALASCHNVSEAISRILKHPRSHGALLMLGDASGCLARLELSGRSSHVEWLSDPAGILYQTNSYRSEQMQSKQVCADACYRDPCPEALRGVRILASSEQRDSRLHDILNQSEKVHIDESLHLLNDHGQTHEGDANTICMHGGYWSTVASVQMLPQSRLFRVGYGPACCTTYHDFAL